MGRARSSAMSQDHSRTKNKKLGTTANTSGLRQYLSPHVPWGTRPTHSRPGLRLRQISFYSRRSVASAGARGSRVAPRHRGRTPPASPDSAAPPRPAVSAPHFYAVPGHAAGPGHAPRATLYLTALTLSFRPFPQPRKLGTVHVETLVKRRRVLNPPLLCESQTHARPPSGTPRRCVHLSARRPPPRRPQTQRGPPEPII